MSCVRVVLTAVCLLACLTAVRGGPEASSAVSGDDLAGRLTAARAALEDGLHELAQKECERYLADAKKRGITANVPEATLLLMRSLHEQGRHSELSALIHSLRGRWKKEGRLDALVFWKALTHHKIEEFDKALSATEQFSADFPGSSYAGRVSRIRAWCHLQAGNVEDALLGFARFYAEYPGSEQAADNLLDWGKALVSIDRTNEAQEVLGKLAVMPQADDTVHEGQYWLARVLILRKQWDKAGAILEPLAENADVDDNDRGRAWLALAQVKRAQDNVEDAVSAFRAGIDIARSAELKREGGFGLGRLLVATGEFDAGLPLLKGLIAEVPEDPAAETTQLSLAASLLDAKRLPEAVDGFQHYLETFTNGLGRAKACRGKGWGLSALGRYAEAATAFMKAYDLFADSASRAQCLFKVADSYFANAQYKLAADVYLRLLDEFQDSPLTASALFQLAECKVHDDMPGEGEDMFRQLAVRFPENPLAEEALLRMAQIKEDERRWLEAIDGFNMLMNTYSNGAYYAEALHGKGLVLYRLFRFREALGDFERVVSGFADSSVAEQAFYQRGMCYYWIGHDERALAICGEFLDKYPESQWVPDVLFWLGKYHHNHENYEEAETYLVMFAEKYPEHALGDDALLWAGKSAAKRKEYLRSVDLLTRLVKDYPKSDKMPEARFAQADVLSLLAKSAGAIVIFDEIISKYPDSGLILAAWGRTGDCQFTLGAEDPKRYEESIASYRVVVNSSDADLDMIMHAEYGIGRSYQKLGREDDAFEQYYLKVILRYFEDRENGVWHNGASKVWFTRAAYATVDILEARNDWRRVVRILQRVVDAGVLAAEEARERIDKIRSEHWWLFY